MPNQGELKSPVLLDLAIQLGYDCSLSERDIDTVRRRYTSEGLTFLTMSLNSLAKALCRGVTDGLFVRPDGFKPRSNKDVRPAFCHGLFSEIFDEDGAYYPDADPVSYAMLYQFTSFFFKMKQDYTDEQTAAFSDQFIETDDQIGYFRTPENSVTRNASAYISTLFSDFDPSSILCKDGPGVTANSTLLEKGTKKLMPLPITRTRYLPHFFLSQAAMDDEISRFPDMVAEDVRINNSCSKVIFVPKDSRGPRVISAEPRENQFVQQGLRSYFYNAIENHPSSRGYVNFEDQSVNGALALSSSLSREYATIDLKEASDRISLDLVCRLFSGLPELRDYLLDSRSYKAKLPDGRETILNKFAPMGSAVCFPVLAIVIFALLREIPISSSDPINLGLYVYGDDIVIRKQFADRAYRILSDYGLAVNNSKSYVGGPFAESCGVDAFRGNNVTPVRLRVSPGGLKGCIRKKAGTRVYKDLDLDAVSLIETANQLADHGYHNSAVFLASKINDTFGCIPLGYPHSSSPCYWKTTVLGSLYNGKPAKVRYWSIKPVETVNGEETGWTHLLRTINMLGHHSEIPEFGSYCLPKQSIIRPTRKPKWFDHKYPACNWVPC